MARDDHVPTRRHAARRHAARRRAAAAYRAAARRGCTPLRVGVGVRGRGMVEKVRYRHLEDGQKGNETDGFVRAPERGLPDSTVDLGRRMLPQDSQTRTRAPRASVDAYACACTCDSKSCCKPARAL
eukprot:scaffold124544_cov63-Phaeocystis_antarctica.AAC.1